MVRRVASRCLQSVQPARYVTAVIFSTAHSLASSLQGECEMPNHASRRSTREAVAAAAKIRAEVSRHSTARGRARRDGDVRQRRTNPKLAPNDGDISSPRLSLCQVNHWYPGGSIPQPQGLNDAYCWVIALASDFKGVDTGVERGMERPIRPLRPCSCHLVRALHASKQAFRTITRHGVRLYAPPRRMRIRPPAPGRYR